MRACTVKLVQSPLTSCTLGTALCLVDALINLNPGYSVGVRNGGAVTKMKKWLHTINR